MFSLSSSLVYLLYAHGVDMRKILDGLSALIREGFGLDPTNVWVYIFINKGRDKAKLLHWQSGGFVLYYKRLEHGSFELPHYDASIGSISLDYTQLALLIDGVSLTNLHRKRRYKLPDTP